MQLYAAQGRHLRLTVPNTCRRSSRWAALSLMVWSVVVAIDARMSVLPQGFADPSLGELILANDALGIDPQQHVHAVPGPLLAPLTIGYLG